MTYKKAADTILAKLSDEGWVTSHPGLKTRWAEKNGIRVWFKARSLWRGDKRPENSLWLDTKALAEFEGHLIVKLVAKRFEA